MKRILRSTGSMLAALVCIMMTGCSSDAPGNDGGSGLDPLVPDAEMRSWLSAQSEADMKVLSALAAEIPAGENIVYSPLSLRTALAMTANATGDEGTREILGFLGTRDLETLNRHMREIADNFPGLDPEVTMSTANSVWLRDGLTVRKEFADVTASAYRAGTFGYSSTGDGEETAGRINSWVSDRTSGMIPQILDDFNPSTTLVAIVNALYFRAPWGEGFDEGLSATQRFTCTDGTVSEVRMMRDPDRTASYFEDERMKAVTLDFGAGRFAATFVLPARGTDIRGLVSSLGPSDLTAWNGIDTCVGEIDLELPVFEMSSSLDLIPTLMECGLGSLFDDARWTGLTDSDQTLAVTLLRQAVRLRINERGGEAAAGTVVEGGLTSPGPQRMVFHADRPFFYMIFEKACGMPLFMGTVERLP